MNKGILIVILLVILLVGILIIKTAKKNHPPNIDDTSKGFNNNIKINLEIDESASKQEQITKLKEIAMIYYTNQGDLNEAEKLFDGKKFKKKNDVVKEAFKRASLINPYDLQLLYSLSSLAIMKRNLPEALELYDRMLNIDDKHFDALLMKAIYSKVAGDYETSQHSFAKLMEIDSEKTEVYREKVMFVDQLKDLTFNKTVPDDLPINQHAFIVLGYALSDEGEIQKTLLKRLKITLMAAEKYPDSKVIVTGGIPKNGITEADAMCEWLIEQGIAKERIIKENKSTDTIDNALLTMDLVEREGVNDITLITSAKHMRRAIALFHEADLIVQRKNNQNKKRNISQVVYYDYKENENDTMSKAQEIVIYRDLMRTSGIWLFPELYR